MGLRTSIYRIMKKKKNAGFVARMHQGFLESNHQPQWGFGRERTCLQQGRIGGLLLFIVALCQKGVWEMGLNH